MRRSLCLLAVLWGCSEPPAPSYPPRSEIGPELDQARFCNPPFSSVGNHSFYFADLDEAQSCSVYLEQDDCVVAIFQDCPLAGSSVPRQWQGRTYNEQTDKLLYMRPYLPSGASMPARNPNCCVGKILGDGDETSALLSCARNRNCNGVPEEAQDHVGILLQRVLGDPHPEARLDPNRITVGNLAVQVTRLLTLPGRGELWALIDGPGGGGNDGLYEINLGGTGATLSIGATSDQTLTSAIGSDALYLGDGDRVTRMVPGMASGPAVSVGAVISAMVSTRDGLLLATQDGANSTLRLLDPVSLTERASASRAGRITDLAAGPDQDPSVLAALSYAGNPVIERVGPAPALTVGTTATLKPNILPTRLHHLSQDVYGFVARCWDMAVAPPCYWQHDFGTGQDERTSAPNVEGVTGFVVDADGKHVHLASASGPITVLIRGPLRPLLDQTVPLEEPSSELALAPDGRIWVLLPNSGRLARLDPLQP